MLFVLKLAASQSESILITPSLPLRDISANYQLSVSPSFSGYNSRKVLYSTNCRGVNCRGVNCRGSIVGGGGGGGGLIVVLSPRFRDN